jgi:hypothetical protein
MINGKHLMHFIQHGWKKRNRFVIQIIIMKLGIVLFLLLLSGASDAQKISGVVTYFYNPLYGDKPDTGAQVYVVDSTKENSTFFDRLDTFHLVYDYRSRYESNHKTLFKFNDHEKQVAKKYNITNDAAFKSLDERTYATFLSLSDLPDVIRITIPANGDYETNVKPGTYYVLIKSNNRNGKSVTELKGRLDYLKIKISAGEEKRVDKKFDIY